MNEHIQFGTDGWRAIISDQFTIRNVKRVAQAACSVLSQQGRNKLILVGYDRRFFSDRFAREAARVALANGFKVEISDRPISSPALSFNVKARKAIMGFMITASHNPFTFNGFKLKGPHGGSVDELMTGRVERALDLEEPRTTSDPAKSSDFVSPYLQSLKKYVSAQVLDKLPLPVVFDAMNGPGGDLIDGIVGEHKKLKIIRQGSDVLFGGGAPEPIERYLAPLKEAILNNRAGAGFAVDGDVDRIGAIDDKGRYLPPTLVMPLLLLHLIEDRKLKGKIIQTVSMGYLPGRIASKFGFDFEETQVGFKHIASRMLKEKVLLGGEESGGYGIGLWSPERDGLLCALLLAEMMAVRKKPLSVLVDDMQKEFGASHFERVDFQLNRPVKKAEWTTSIKSQINSSLGSLTIQSIREDDGLKIATTNGAWVLLRPSGTEPLIRTYAEAPDTASVQVLLKEAERLVRQQGQKEDDDALAKLKKTKISAKKK